MLKNISIFSLFSLVLFISSCGYQFQGGGSVLPPEIKTVAIPLVKNQTSSPGVELVLTEALRARFDRFAALRVVEDEDQADSILKAKVINIDSQVRDTTGQTDIALGLDIVMTVSAELLKSDGTLLWRNNNIVVIEPIESVSDTVVTSGSQFAQYGIDRNTLGGLNALEVSRGQSEQAYENMSNEVARQIYNSAVAANF